MLYEWTTVQSPQIDLVSNLQGHHGFVIWSSPPPGKVKINIDAALFPPQKKIGVGCIVRDAEGIMLSGFSKPITGNYTTKEAKALGVREALSWLKTKHWSFFILEMDSLQVFHDLLSSSIDNSYSSLIISYCKSLCSCISKVKFFFV